MLTAAIIGTGRIAGGYDEDRADSQVFSHAGAYRVHDGVEIVACVEPDRERRASFMKRWEIAAGYDDIDAWIADGGSADVVSLCSPDETHEALLRKLAQSDCRAIWAEKPVAADPEKARDLAAALDGAGKIVAVNYLRRWDPVMNRLRDSFVGGELGDLQSAVAWYGKGLIHNGSHALDLFRYLFGALEPVSARRTLDIGIDPTLDCLLETAAGQPVRLLGVDESHFTLFEMTIVTTKGRIDIEDSGFTLRTRLSGPDPVFDGYWRLRQADTVATGLGEAMTRAVANLYDAVMDGHPVACDAAEAAETAALCGELRRMAGIELEPAA
jgi:predicted dehydrogenase